ncbi:MAG: hypothetical protein V3U78_09205 [Thiotrichaceae bacterium]
MEQLFSKSRWQQLMASLSITKNDDEFMLLQEAYCESHRAYHTLQHISECIAMLDWACSESLVGVDKAGLAEVALWYHDVIYQPKAKDNEQKSAEWAKQILNTAGVSAQDSQFVYSLIMATRHGEKPTEPTHQLVVDIDLAILGAKPARFAEYEKQVRQEYQWVPWFIYRKKRAAYLGTSKKQLQYFDLSFHSRLNDLKSLHSATMRLLRSFNQKQKSCVKSY